MGDTVFNLTGVSTCDGLADDTLNAVKYCMHGLKYHHDGDRSIAKAA